MSGIAWIFPGQGSQRVGMGRDLAERSDAARMVFQTADDALDFPLSAIIFEGPEEELVKTSIQQPALLATCIAYQRVLQERGELPAPVCVAGHSLGEYTALVAAGALELADAIRIVRRRGELMEHYGMGGMIAVLGLDLEPLEAVAAEAGVEIANFNAPGQITLSSRAEGLERATVLAKQAGARRVLPLPVNGAFHSSLMAPVVEELRPLIEATPLRPPIAPLVANVDARLLSEPDELRAELLAQITASVRWVDVVRAAVDTGATCFYEIGPGKVLSGLVGRIVPETQTVPVEPLFVAAADR